MAKRVKLKEEEYAFGAVEGVFEALPTEVRAAILSWTSGQFLYRYSFLTSKNLRQNGQYIANNELWRALYLAEWRSTPPWRCPLLRPDVDPAVAESVTLLQERASPSIVDWISELRDRSDVPWRVQRLWTEYRSNLTLRFGPEAATWFHQLTPEEIATIRVRFPNLRREVWSMLEIASFECPFMDDSVAECSELENVDPPLVLAFQRPEKWTYVPAPQILVSHPKHHPTPTKSVPVAYPQLIELEYRLATRQTTVSGEDDGSSYEQSEDTDESSSGFDSEERLARQEEEILDEEEKGEDRWIRLGGIRPYFILLDCLTGRIVVKEDEYDDGDYYCFANLAKLIQADLERFETVTDDFYGIGREVEHAVGMNNPVLTYPNWQVDKANYLSEISSQVQDTLRAMSTDTEISARAEHLIETFVTNELLPDLVSRASTYANESGQPLCGLHVRLAAVDLNLLHEQKLVPSAVQMAAGFDLVPPPQANSIETIHCESEEDEESEEDWALGASNEHMGMWNPYRQSASDPAYRNHFDLLVLPEVRVPDHFKAACDAIAAPESHPILAGVFEQLGSDAYWPFQAATQTTPSESDTLDPQTKAQSQHSCELLIKIARKTLTLLSSDGIMQKYPDSGSLHSRIKKLDGLNVLIYVLRCAYRKEASLFVTAAAVRDFAPVVQVLGEMAGKLKELVDDLWSPRKVWWTWADTLFF